VSQKATKLTSFAYRSALQVTRRKRDFQTRPGNVKQKHQNRAKGPSNFPHDCKFCKMLKGVSENSVIQCMSCKKSCHENCAGELKRHYFGSTARDVVTLICPFLHHSLILPRLTTIQVGWYFIIRYIQGGAETIRRFKFSAMPTSL
jgi:hypothetical protein